MAGEIKQITFKYVLPEDLRDLYVNGLYGGVTPRNELYVHFYSERHAIPKKTTHEIDTNDTLGAELATEKGGDVVRLVQTSIMMDVGTAIVFRNWLNEKIDFINERNT